MNDKAPSRVELLPGTLDLLILRTLIDKHDRGKRTRYYRLTALGRKQPGTEQSKWQTSTRAMGLFLNPMDQEGQ